MRGAEDELRPQRRARKDIGRDKPCITEESKSGVNLSSSASQLCELANYLTILGLSVLCCEMGVLAVPASQG